MSEYAHSPYAFQSAYVIICYKTQRQASLLAFPITESKLPTTIGQLLLFEGRIAQQYWKQFRKKLPLWTTFVSRKARNNDVVNRLLDIGHHHLAGIVTKICLANGMTPALGLIHKAKTEKSKPLVYDLMELFRADVVDREVLRFFCLKKKPCTTIDEKDISDFLHRINKRLERKVYLKDFRQCHTYRYSMEVQILKFQKAVNHNEVFKPIILPQRHESRCY